MVNKEANDCDCPDHAIRHISCKHQLAVRAHLRDPEVIAAMRLVAPVSDGWEPETEDDLDDIFGPQEEVEPESEGLESESKMFSIVHVLRGAPPERPSVLVSDLLVDRDINLWTGHGGTGKTVLVLVTAVSVALGLPVFGSLAVHRPGVVLLVLPEDGQSAARMMLDAIIAGMNLDEDQYDLCVERLIMITDDEAVSLVNDSCRLAETASRLNAVLVVLDPLRNLLGGAAENDNDVAGACQNTLRRDVCRGAGATILQTAHTRKPGKDVLPDAAASRHDTRGASGWVDGSRLVFAIAKNGGRITMSAVKANRLKSDLRHEVNLTIDADTENHALWQSCTIVDANTGATSEVLTAGKGRALNANEQTAIACLDDQHEADKRLSWSTWRDDSGLNANTFRSVKKRLLDAGLVTALPTGRKNRNGGADYSYQITTEGRTALQSGWSFERSSGEGVRSGE